MSQVGEEQIQELELSLKNINWDIIGLSETRREGENWSGDIMVTCFTILGLHWDIEE